MDSFKELYMKENGKMEINMVRALSMRAMETGLNHSLRMGYYMEKQPSITQTGERKKEYI